MNSYIYLSDEIYETICKKINDTVVKYDIENIILHNNPVKIIIYINRYDHAFINDSKRFIKFCQKNIPNKFKYVIHDNISEKIKENNGHRNFMPKDVTLDEIIMNALQI